MRLKAHITLGPAHRATGRTRHVVYGAAMPHPAQLRVVQFPGDEGFYLLYCTAAGEEMTDTHHATLEAAFAQAAWEFNVSAAEWTLVADA